ncbi:hypothetical protein D3C87_882490 [compost metagenome]
MVGNPVLAGNTVEIRCCIAQVAGGGQHVAHAVAGSDAVAAITIGRSDAIGQHDLRADFGKSSTRGFRDRVCLRGKNDGNARIGAELAGTHGERTRPALGNGFTASRNGFRQQEHRVDRTEFAEEGDRLGALGAEVEERAAAGERTGETDRLDARMLHERGTDIAAAALDQREDAGMQIVLLNGGENGFGNDFAGAGMGGVTLDNHWAAGRQSRCGVTAGRGESEREVGGAEDRNGADRTLHQTDIRARQRLAIRQRFVMATVEIVALADMRSEETELANGAAAFALQASCGQAGFGRADFGDGVGAGFDLIGDGVEECGALFAGGVTVAPESFFGSFTGRIHQIDGADRKIESFAMCRLAAEFCFRCDPFSCNQMFAVRLETHCALP